MDLEPEGHENQKRDISNKKAPTWGGPITWDPKFWDIFLKPDKRSEEAARD